MAIATREIRRNFPANRLKLQLCTLRITCQLYNRDFLKLLRFFAPIEGLNLIKIHGAMEKTTLLTSKSVHEWVFFRGVHETSEKSEIVGLAKSCAPPLSILIRGLFVARHRAVTVIYWVSSDNFRLFNRTEGIDTRNQLRRVCSTSGCKDSVTQTATKFITHIGIKA